MREIKKISAETRKRYLINLVMFILFIGVAASSLYFLYVPGGYQGGRNPRFNMRILFTRETWDAIHLWTSLMLSSILLLHFFLHTEWIKQVFIKYVRSWKKSVREKNALRIVNVVDDGLSAIFFVICLLSGLVLFFIPGGRGSDAIRFLTITRESLKVMHTWTGIGMLAGIVVHLAIHWNWIKKVSLRVMIKENHSTMRQSASSENS